MSRRGIYGGIDKPDERQPAILAELSEDNKRFNALLRQVQDVCDEHTDVARMGLLDNFVDQAETRAWSLCETSRKGEPTLL
jgi:starvation-inducible DNA-binding protein